MSQPISRRADEFADNADSWFCGFSIFSMCQKEGGWVFKNIIEEGCISKNKNILLLMTYLNIAKM